METFWALFKQSIITQAIITVIMVSAITYMVIAGLPIPDWYTGIFFTIVGFWFGSKVGYAQASDPRQARKDEEVSGV